MAIQPKEMERVNNTVIGESILVNGKLEGDEDLTVRGRVQGSITLTKTLIVEPSGVVKADASVRNAIVSGVVVGNITASESVHLTKEGRMVGDINAPRVIIVEGAAFRGRVDMGDANSEARTSRPAAQPVSARPSMSSMSSMSSRPASTPSRPPSPPPVRAVPRPPEPPRPMSKPPEAPKPPAPPPPPAMKAAAASETAPMPVGIAKRKVVVKRKR